MHRTSRSKFGLTLSLSFLLLTSAVLAACGDNTATPAPAATPAGLATAGNSAPGATTAPLLSTPAPAGTTVPAATTAAASNTGAGTATAGSATTAAGASSGAVNLSANACQDSPAPATAATGGPQPTTTVTTLADIPDLNYTGSRELKPQAATIQGVLGNLNSPRFEQTLGKFTGDKLNFSASNDPYDKVDGYYRKQLQDAGWQLVKGEQEKEAKQSLLVFQKGGSKIVMSIETVEDAANYPAEFKDTLKKGDTLILTSSGKAASSAPEPTPFAIPGSPTMEVKSGQKKYATIEMEKGGKVKIELCPLLAPKTVENFEKLAVKGFYNGLTFHRVEKEPKPFVVQGGDPKGDGTGGPGYQIPDEFTTQKRHMRGTVAMAHSAAPHSAGSQFYICLDEASFLDGKYAIFGQVVEGMDVVDKIVKGDKMKSVTITVS